MINIHDDLIFSTNTVTNVASNDVSALLIAFNVSKTQQKKNHGTYTVVKTTCFNRLLGFSLVRNDVQIGHISFNNPRK